jgi:hypothetical protein
MSSRNRSIGTTCRCTSGEPAVAALELLEGQVQHLAHASSCSRLGIRHLAPRRLLQLLHMRRAFLRVVRPPFVWAKM